MEFNKNDIAIIELALREAVYNSTDYEVIEQYSNVLERLKYFSQKPADPQTDGFRYDYDDNSSI